jgi:hypothetical protein
VPTRIGFLPSEERKLGIKSNQSQSERKGPDLTSRAAVGFEKCCWPANSWFLNARTCSDLHENVLIYHIGDACGCKKTAGIKEQQACGG